jgi:hypothetical protein
MAQQNEQKDKATVARYFVIRDEVERYEHMRRYDLKPKDYEAVTEVKLAGRKIVGQVQD